MKHAFGYTARYYSSLKRLLCLLVLLNGSMGLCLPRSCNAQVLPVRTVIFNGQPIDAVAGEVLVQLFPDMDTPELVKQVSAVGQIIGGITDFHEYHLKLPDGITIEAAVATLMKLPGVSYAEPNGILQCTSTPNDYYFTHTLLSGYPAQYGPQKVSAPSAWNIWQPRQQIVIAIVDTGVDNTHPDLSNKILYKSGAIYGYNAINNPYTQTVTDPPSSAASDDNGHGTHVAGIAAAQTNNDTGYDTVTMKYKTGMAGIAGWTGIAGQSDISFIKVMPIKQSDSNGNGTWQTAADSIKWAADHGANVLNMSFGSSSISDSNKSILNTSVQYAWSKGCVLIASAGNNGTSASSYPAALANMISVAASDSTDKLAGFSNYGSWVSVAAPGGQGTLSSNVASEGILSTIPTYTTTGFGSSTYYGYDWGTSMAAPHVAGEAALLWAQNPGLTNAQIDAWITGRTDTVTPYTTGNTIAGGRINIYHSLLGATGNVVAAPDLNRNSHPALLWQSQQTGILSTWAMTNVTHYATGLIANTTGGTDWHVRASADFNGDGMPDLLWQNVVTGDVYLWYLTTSATVSRTASVATAQPLNWKIVGVADFNLDGKPDILWQNTTNGDVVVWYMNGATNVGYNYLSSGGASGWTITGCADFNNDGHPDILLQNNSTGQGAVWYFTFNLAYSNPNVYLGYAYLSSASGTPLAGDVNWPQVAIADFNGDGKPDIVLQNVTTGEVVVWYMNNYSQSSYAYVVP